MTHEFYINYFPVRPILSVMVSVLISAIVEGFSVSRMHDFSLSEIVPPPLPTKSLQSMNTKPKNQNQKQKYIYVFSFFSFFGGIGSGN